MDQPEKTRALGSRGSYLISAGGINVSDTTLRDETINFVGDVPMHDPAVRLAFFKEVGQQADFQAVHGPGGPRWVKYPNGIGVSVPEISTPRRRYRARGDQPGALG